MARWTTRRSARRPRSRRTPTGGAALEGARPRDQHDPGRRACGDADRLRDPARHGLRQTIGDTLGIGGIFRGAAHDPRPAGDRRATWRELCPARGCSTTRTRWRCSAGPSTRDRRTRRWSGSATRVQHTTRQLAELVDVPFEEIDLPRRRHQPPGVHPALRARRARTSTRCCDEAIEADPELQRRVRVEMYRRLGYFPTESSEHSRSTCRGSCATTRCRALPAPGRRVRPAQRGEPRASTSGRAAKLAAGEPFEIERSLEYGSLIVHSIETGRRASSTATSATTGLITNLPEGACVEVPCVVDRTGVRPTMVGELPPQLAALNRTFLNVCELTVRAALEGTASTCYHAALLDPNTAATLVARPDPRDGRRAARGPRGEPAGGVARCDTLGANLKRRGGPMSTQAGWHIADVNDIPPVKPDWPATWEVCPPSLRHHRVRDQRGHQGRGQRAHPRARRACVRSAGDLLRALRQRPGDPGSARPTKHRRAR